MRAIGVLTDTLCHDARGGQTIREHTEAEVSAAVTADPRFCELCEGGTRGESGSI